MRYPQIMGAKPCVLKSQYDLLKKVTIDTSICPPLCPQDCQNTRFDASVSYLQIFTYLTYKNIAMLAHDELVNVFETEEITHEMLMQSFAGVRIFFHDIKRTEIVEAPAMSTIELISNIGGTIGLFIEFSFMTFIDFIEIVIEIFIVLWRSNINR